LIGNEEGGETRKKRTAHLRRTMKDEVNNEETVQERGLWTGDDVRDYRSVGHL